jgi:predicted nucleotide-binding protein (sugar kinase/HSP70/actin superfamily)
LGDNVKRVTFPHLGTLHITVEHYLRALGLEPVTPPFTSRRTLDLGVRHCPEMTCAPCKILFGNYYEGLEQGADDLILFGGPDTCRLGYLAQIQGGRLQEAGFQFVPHTLSLRGIAADLLRLTRELADPAPLELVEAARTLVASLSLVDGIEQEALKLRPGELERGVANHQRAEALRAARACGDRDEIQAHRLEILAPLRAAARDPDRCVYRVVLLGDIYSISEPFFNMNLEQQLGDLGVEVDRWFWLSRSLRLSMFDRLLHREEIQAREEEAARYLGRDVGGFAYPSLKGAVSYLQAGVDGLVHLAPFDCSPEIVAASVLPRLARDYDVPLLSLSFDEQTGQAGLTTRLEAFVDLLERRAHRAGPGSRQHGGPAPRGPARGRSIRSLPRGKG